MIDALLIFLSSAVIDVGAVIFTRSVQHSRILIGTLTTGILATLNWLSIWLVVRHSDSLIVPSIIGHMVGFVCGMLVPLKAASQTDCPTKGPGSRSSDPS